MKIYCVLNDSIPLGNLLETYLIKKGFHHSTQISNYFSTTSTISLLTGDLPSDLEKGGIGYHTHFGKKINGNTEYPWKNKLITHKLYKQGWDIHFHNSNWFYLTICNDKFINKTTSMPVKVEDEEKFRNEGNYNELLLDGNSEFYKNEKEFIQKIQAEKTDKNKFYFIKNNQYHQAIVSRKDKTESLKLIEQWFGYWDFEEENALFVFFSDHTDFTKMDKLCKPPSMLTWSCLKDNIKFTKKPVLKYNEIGELYFTMLHCMSDWDIFGDINDWTLDFHTPSQKWINPGFYDRKNRIYFSEDARCEIDTLNSTTAVACKFISWEGNKADEMLQVTYYKPEDKYYGFKYYLNIKKCVEMSPDLELKEALKARISWIK